MGLDLSKLEKVKNHSLKVIARCPACAETGNDRKGEHLSIYPDGKFGCVVNPVPEGRKHRQRIFELVGIKDGRRNGFKIRKPLYFNVLKQNVIQKDILGRLGRYNLTYARSDFNRDVYIKGIKHNGFKTPVPAVPEDSQFLFSPDELEMLQGIDLESLKRIDEVKRLFNGTVIALTDQT